MIARWVDTGDCPPRPTASRHLALSNAHNIRNIAHWEGQREYHDVVNNRFQVSSSKARTVKSPLKSKAKENMGSLWVDRYRPARLDDLSYHAPLTGTLKSLASLFVLLFKFRGRLLENERDAHRANL